jgi:hypothetical protein
MTMAIDSHNWHGLILLKKSGLLLSALALAESDLKKGKNILPSKSDLPSRILLIYLLHNLVFFA